MDSWVTKLRFKPSSDEPASQNGEPSLLGGRSAAAAKTASKAERTKPCFSHGDIGFRRCLGRWIREEDGQDVVEYALLTAVIGLAGVVAFALLANNVGVAYVNWDGAEQNLWVPNDPGAP